MSVPNASFLVKLCIRPEDPHPCDNIPCDPIKKTEGICDPPYVCLERLKNPYLKHERTFCLPGKYMNVKTCTIPEPDHPCDPPVPCSVKGPKRNCQDPVLCEHRIKNPEVPKRPITTDCDPTK